MEDRILKYLIFFLSLISLRAEAQQLPTYTEYFFDKTIINPAFTGTQAYVLGTLAHRSMYAGIEGGPTTQFLSVSGPWQIKNIGLGLIGINDKVGAINTTKVNINTSYYVGLGKGRLSLGLAVGAINYALNFSNLIRTDLIDPALADNKLSKIIPDASFGIFYQTQTYFLGYSAMQLLPSKANLTGNKRSPIAKLYTHGFLTAGLNLSLNEKLRLEPSTLIKTVNASPLQYDLNIRALALNTFGVGFSLRSKESIAGLIEVLIKDQYRIGIAYDRPTNKLSSFSKGSVEIMLTYRKKLLPPARQREIHPRYYVY